MTMLQILHTSLPKSRRKRQFSTPGRRDRIYCKHFGSYGETIIYWVYERSQINLKSSRVVTKQIPSKGDIVQIKANVPRGSWKIGKIIEFLPNSEGKLRGANVLLVTESTVNRPLNLLHPIECKSLVNDTTEKSKQLSGSSTQSQEKLDKSTKESTLQNLTRWSAQKATAGAWDKILGYNLQEQLNWIIAVGMSWTFENISLRELSNLCNSKIQQKYLLSHFLSRIFECIYIYIYIYKRN